MPDGVGQQEHIYQAFAVLSEACRWRDVGQFVCQTKLQSAACGSNEPTQSPSRRITPPVLVGRDHWLASTSTSRQLHLVQARAPPRHPQQFRRFHKQHYISTCLCCGALAFLSTHELDRDIGDTGEYSNVGFGLLGHALALREGTDFERLIGERILEPLHMSNTAVELAPALR